jgi:hypothetical protein
MMISRGFIRLGPTESVMVFSKLPRLPIEETKSNDDRLRLSTRIDKNQRSYIILEDLYAIQVLNRMDMFQSMFTN